jgi:hypothetical protein
MLDSSAFVGLVKGLASIHAVGSTEVIFASSRVSERTVLPSLSTSNVTTAIQSMDPLNEELGNTYSSGWNGSASTATRASSLSTTRAMTRWFTPWHVNGAVPDQPEWDMDQARLQDPSPVLWMTPCRATQPRATCFNSLTLPHTPPSVRCFHRPDPRPQIPTASLLPTLVWVTAPAESTCPDPGERLEVDEDLAQLLVELWRRGVPTYNSCQNAPSTVEDGAESGEATHSLCDGRGSAVVRLADR